MTITLHYESYGDGEKIYVGIPGFGASHHKSFGLMIDHLPAAVKFYGIDPPGVGKSESPEHWSWDSINALIAQAVREISQKEGKPVTMIGACSGSFHAMETSMLAPECVERLYLIEPFAFLPWYSYPFVSPTLGPIMLYSVFGSEIGRKSLQTFLTLMGFTGGFDTMSSFAKVHWRDLYSYLSIYKEASDRGAMALGQLEMPVRIYTGSRTMQAMKDSIEIWKGILKDVTVFTVDNVGHQVTQEDPERITELLFDDLLETIAMATDPVPAEVIA